MTLSELIPQVADPSGQILPVPQVLDRRSVGKEAKKVQTRRGRRVRIGIEVANEPVSGGFGERERERERG